MCMRKERKRNRNVRESQKVVFEILIIHALKIMSIQCCLPCIVCVYLCEFIRNKQRTSQESSTRVNGIEVFGTRVFVT